MIIMPYKEISPYSNEDLREIIEQEGLGYAIMHYVSSGNIQDETVAMWWKKASEALAGVLEVLNIE